LIAAVVLAIFAAASLAGADCSMAKAKKIKTHYTNYDTNLRGDVSTRCRVTSYLLGRETNYGKKYEAGEVVNTTNREATRSISLARNKSRSVSISFTAAIPERVVKSDIKATIGGSVTYSMTVTLTGSAVLPPKSRRSVYIRRKYKLAKYKYRVQKQRKTLYGKWKNVGKAYTKYNTSKTNVPVLIL